MPKAEILIAIAGDITPTRAYDPAMPDSAKAKTAAEQLGAELARRGARLLVYGGPFLEADVVRGYVSAGPAKDHCILMWYARENQPKPFDEEKSHPRFFERKVQQGVEWETAFYRSITKADGLILMGGGHATKISGQVAIGLRMPLLAFPEFGGSAELVWNSLSPGEDLPTRSEIDRMAMPWQDRSAAACVDLLYRQHARKQASTSVAQPALAVIGAILFLAALAVVPWVWAKSELPVWLLFFAPVLAGGAGAAIRPMVDRQRQVASVSAAVLTTVVLGLVAGGIAGLLFVTAQLTASTNLLTAAVAQEVVSYAERSIPFAVAVGFIAGFTSDLVFGKLLGLEVVRTDGVGNLSPAP